MKRPPTLTIELRFQLIDESDRPNFGYAYYDRDDDQHRTVTIALNNHFEIVAEAIKSHNYRIVALLTGLLLCEITMRYRPRPLRLLREYLHAQWQLPRGLRMALAFEFGRRWEEKIKALPIFEHANSEYHPLDNFTVPNPPP